MTSNFSRQIEPCPRNGLYVRSLPAPKGNSAPPIPRAAYDQSAPDGKLDHKTQATFLKALIAHEAGEASLRLRESLAKADREWKRIRHALFLMVTLLILALAGLCYCALLLPQIYSSPGHFVTKSLSFLGLASLIALLELLGYLLWHRFAVSRLHKECRRWVLLLVEPQLRASLRRGPGVDTCQEPESTLASACRPTDRR
jgi:hypothetical protein